MQRSGGAEERRRREEGPAVQQTLWTRTLELNMTSESILRETTTIFGRVGVAMKIALRAGQRSALTCTFESSWLPRFSDGESLTVGRVVPTIPTRNCISRGPL